MKALFAFGFPFFMRVLVPGTFATFVFFPFKYIFGYSITNNLQFNLGFAITTGLLVVFAGDHIYKIYEGYYLWPAKFREYFTCRLNKRLIMKYSQYKATTSRAEKQIINDWMLMFPLKEVKEEGQPRYEAQMPTLLGNILRTYENYPMSRYNISSVFFWPIFWLTVDKDNRKEIDEQWVVADCLLYMSFISAIYSILYALLFVADIISGWLGYYIISVPDLISKNFTHTSYLFTAIYLCLIVSLIFASRFLYILSLPHHVKNGGFYQAIFDLNRHKIKEVIYIKEDDNDFWDQAWAYLQYKLVKCKKCGRFADINSLRDAVCERCFEIDESSEISGRQD